MTFGERLRVARRAKNMTQKDLAEIIGAKHNSISNWENNQNMPDPSMIEYICGALDITPTYLLTGKSDRGFSVYGHPDILPIETKKIPLLGDIACGEPIVANQEYDSYVEVGTEIQVDFAVRAKGDSMVNTRILDGDIVFIRQQDIVENGEIAAVIIGDEVTLKRFNRQGDLIILSPENNAMAPTVINLKEQHNIRILGKAIAFQSDVR